MKQQANNNGKNNFCQLNFTDRQFIEKCFGKLSPIEISNLLGVHKSTVYRELKLGLVAQKYVKYDELAVILHGEREYKLRMKYSAEQAELMRKFNSSAKGVTEKLGNNYEFAKLIAKYIKKGYSPDIALNKIKRKHPEIELKICTKTLYNYIDKSYIPDITNKDLLEKGKRHKKKFKQVRKAFTNRDGLSIDKRPKCANDRSEFGHWEIDLIVGKQGTKNVLLTLTERQTRYEIIRKLPNKKQKTIAKALDSIERKLGKKFKVIFKTITSDNGTEFLDHKAIEKSCLTKQKRTTVYYAHPYSSWERGSNEVGNRFIRRFVAKGKDISKYSRNNIANIMEWINNYPRKILGYKTAQEMVENWGL